jgi:hypothetical protein
MDVSCVFAGRAARVPGRLVAVNAASKWSSDYLVTEPGVQARHIFIRRVWRASQLNFEATSTHEQCIWTQLHHRARAECLA